MSDYKSRSEKYNKTSISKSERQANHALIKLAIFSGVLTVLGMGAVSLGKSNSETVYNAKTAYIKLTNQGNKEAENSIKYLKGEVELSGYEADASNSILYDVPIDQRESVFHDYCEDINATNEEELKAAYPEIFGNEPKTR